MSWLRRAWLSVTESDRAGRVAIAIAALTACLAAPAAWAQSCPGDCNGNGEVSLDELIVSANLALGTLAPRSCAGVDADGDAQVSVAEAVGAVRSGLRECGGSGGRHMRGALPPAQIALGTVTGSAGAQVVFEAKLYDNGNEVAATQNDIAFDPRTRIVSCEENPAIDKSVFVGFQPFGCTQGVDCTAVRVLVLSLSNVDPIPDGSVLYTCRVAISSTAPDGTYPLLISNMDASTPDGVAIGTEGTHGSVIVDGGAICAGDCDGSQTVTIAELIRGIQMLVGLNPPSSCPAADIDGSGTVTVDELLAATANANSGTCEAPSGPPASSSVSIQLGSVTGEAGDQVTIDAMLFANGQAVAGTQNDISFGALAPIVGCELNPALDKNGSSFVFQPPNCTWGVDCTAMRALVTGLDNLNPIPDGLLYSCTVAIDPFTPEGVYFLGNFALRAGTPGGLPVPAFGVDGVITVGEPPPPGDTTIVVSHVTGLPGQVVTFEIGLETSDDVVATENELAFDVGAPVVFTACAVNPDINRPQSAFAFRPNDCVPGVNCSGVKSIIISFSDLTPIQNGSTLYSCDALILPTAPPGVYPIDCFAPGAASPIGEAIDSICVDGSVTVLPGGPPVAPASLILERARLRSNTANAPRQNGSVLLSGVVNANAPFGGLTDEIVSGGLSIAVSGAGGAELTLRWQGAQCTAQQSSRGPRIRCDAEDAEGKRRLTLRPTRTPNVLKLKVSASRTALAGPFTDAAVAATLTTASWQRPDSVDSCALRNQGVVTSCRESGIVP